MTASFTAPDELEFAAGLIDDSVLFSRLFSPKAFADVFLQKFSRTSGKGVDRLNGFQFAKRAAIELPIAASKCLAGNYRFAPYLEVLQLKGRKKEPRVIAIPTIRDRIVLHQLNRFLALVFPGRVPRKVASSYIREIAAQLTGLASADTWVCGLDIKTFYDNIQPDRLGSILGRKISCWQALRLISRALSTPTVPKNTPRLKHSEYRPNCGVPQGLAISNILASIYMSDVDVAMSKSGVAYYRYVDDVLMYGSEAVLTRAIRSFRGRLKRRGLRLHPLTSAKSHLGPLPQPFGYLGYVFSLPVVTVRESTVERFLQSIAAKFSDFKHNKARRMERSRYLDEKRMAEIFLLELNEKITGAISEKRRYGWIAYFNEITDLTLLYRLDNSIEALFGRLPEFSLKAPVGLRRLVRSYFEMKFNPTGGYVRNYDVVATPVQKLAFLVDRGLIAPADMLTEVQVSDRFDRYRRRMLAEMQADEGVLY